MNLQFMISTIIMLPISVNASAAPVPALDFNHLIAVSAVVCVGTVMSVGESSKVKKNDGDQTLDLDLKIALIRCHRILKGDLKPGSSIRVEFLESRDMLLPYPPLTAGETSLLFLKESPARTAYELTNPFHGKQVAVDVEPIYDVNLPLLQKVEGELLNVVRHGTDLQALSALDKLYLLKSPQLISGGDSTLDSVVNPQTREALQGTVLALKIQAGDLASLRQVRDLRSMITDRNSYLPWQHHLLSSISQVNNPNAIPIMNELLTGKSAAVRKEASRALESLADGSSLPSLKVCLRDSDSDTAYNCLVALSRLTAIPGPSRAEFERHRAVYIEQWK